MDSTLSSGTLYVDMNGESLSGGRTLTAQIFVNGTAVGATIVYNSTTPNGVQHVAVTGLGITAGSLVTLGVIQNFSGGGEGSGGIISWSVGP